VYAIKRVEFEGEDSCAIEGYKNEIALLNSLGGIKSIIKLFASEVKSDLLLMVMEYGEYDLSNLVKPESRLLPMTQVLCFWEDMLNAVQAIHNQNIVHSDLKPAVRFII